MNIVENNINFINSNKNQINTKIYYVKFDNMTDLQSTIDNEFVDIVHADSTYDLEPTKKEIYKILCKKNDQQQHGAIAEFFAHIVIRKIGFTQQCLYKNLEESSMKKGFDGLYSYNNIFWIMESKSAKEENIHKNKIDEAIKSIRTAIEDLSRNNPWLNAVHHISNLENNQRNDSIKQKVKKLSKDFQEGVKHTINEFNLIPVSTLFLPSSQNLAEIISDINTLLTNTNYRQIIIVCIDNYIFNDFIEYLRN
ncbi:MAG: hypothetical protein J1F32_03065 [Erysipelotrichales bacterium]|nr:hypothetical protein [Erysipelotrichales bacterium]